MAMAWGVGLKTTGVWSNQLVLQKKETKEQIGEETYEKSHS